MSFVLEFARVYSESLVIGLLANVLLVGALWLVWEGCVRLARLLRFAFSLAFQPLAFQIMRVERDHARAAFEAATKISGLRADAARRRAEVTGEPNE